MVLESIGLRVSDLGAYRVEGCGLGLGFRAHGREGLRGLQG